jgi:hypothetical protein
MKLSRLLVKVLIEGSDKSLVYQENDFYKRSSKVAFSSAARGFLI